MAIPVPFQFKCIKETYMLNCDDLVNLGGVTECKYVVDIGASTGVVSDPCYPFITNANYAGLCIEGNRTCIDKLSATVSFDIKVHEGYVTPMNVLPTFDQYKVPKDLFLIKIDIDGYDLEVIRKILSSNYKPIFFIAEINEKIPPPIFFETQFSGSYKWDYSHCFGFSLQSGQKVFESNGYYIVDMYDMNNILCIRKDKAHLIPQYNFPRDAATLYDQQYKNNQKRTETFPWNSDVDNWLTITDPIALKNEIMTYFTTNNQRSTHIDKNKKLNKDFLLYL